MLEIKIDEEEAANEHIQHCDRCFSVDCKALDVRCKLVHCPSCKAKMHGCKIEDHLTLCPKAVVPCPNADSGCPLELKHDFVGAHLAHCPASVVCCSFVRNRAFVNGMAKKKLKLLAKGISPPIKEQNQNGEDEGQRREIDEQLAIKDQTMLEDYFKTPRSYRKFLGVPIPPLDFASMAVEGNNGKTSSSPIDPPKSALIDDSSDEEERQEKLKIKKKKEPFAGCYLCKLNPGSQHLHVLGSMSSGAMAAKLEESANEALKKATEEAQKIIEELSFLPEFYRDQGLLLQPELPFSGFVHEGLNRHQQRPKELIFPLLCPFQSVRRDEFGDHYRQHTILESTAFQRRCPLWHRGCGFTCATMRPKEGRFRYNDFLEIVVHEPKPFILKEEKEKDQNKKHKKNVNEKTTPTDFDRETLRLLGPFLDGASMAALSATNRRVRANCFAALRPRMTVEPRWRKIVPLKNGKEKSDGKNTKFVQDGFIWRFSGVQRGVDPRSLGLSVEPQGALAEHLKECPFLDRKEFAPGESVHVMPLPDESCLFVNDRPGSSCAALSPSPFTVREPSMLVQERILHLLLHDRYFQMVAAEAENEDAEGEDEED